MLKSGLSLVSLALAITCAGASAAGQAPDNGIEGADGTEAPSSGGVTLTLPRCANKGTVVLITVDYPSTNPSDVTVTLDQPTSGPPYKLERKINRRIYDDFASGTNHYFYIDTSSQIGGTAKVKAVVAGVGKASGTFLIPC